MGSIFEINDTLQITKEQGFPSELLIEKHLETPYILEDFENREFRFINKPKLRNYQVPPVRVFLVENIDGKWVYWGLAHILEVEHNYEAQTTSGKFKIIYLNSPEEMKQVYHLVDRDEGKSYL